MDTYIPPKRYLATRAIAMPKDTNPNGDIFGGWMVAQMDLAAGNLARARTHGRAVTVAINDLTFHKPVFVGDEVSCYAEITRLGRTSLTINVEAWVRRFLHRESIKVTEGTFVFVAIEENSYQPRVISKESVFNTDADDQDDKTEV